MSGTVIRFPKMPRVLKARGPKAQPTVSDNRVREATKARLRAALRIILNAIDGLDGQPNRH